MPILKTAASALAGRTVARRVSRVIPNPILRFAVMTAATALAPMVARRVNAALQRRKLARSTEATRPELARI